MSDPPDSIEASDVGESLVLASADVSADAGRLWADVTLVSALLDTWRLYTYTITTSIATVYSHSLGNMYLLGNITLSFETSILTWKRRC